MKAKRGVWDKYRPWVYLYPCPYCNCMLDFHDDGEIKVNCETKGHVKIKGI